MLKRTVRMRVVVAVCAVGVASATLAGPVRAQDDTPLTAARFELSVDGVQIGVFEQLISEADIETGAAGNAITLMGGRTQGIEMAAWHELVILGDVAAARKTALIVMYDHSNSPVRRYHLENAWPSKVVFDGRGRAIKTSTAMLVYDVLRVQEQ
jgi:hypothetical protein